VIGTPYYMSPEQARGEDLDFRSDVYSLGATLFHLVCGHVPFDAATPQKVMFKVARETAPDPRALNPRVSDAAAAVIHKMMAREPAARYSSLDTLLKVLENATIKVYVESAPETPATLPRAVQPAPTAVPVPAVWRRPWFIGTGIALFLLVAVLVVGAFVAGRSQPAPSPTPGERPAEQSKGPPAESPEQLLDRAKRLRAEKKYQEAKRALEAFVSQADPAAAKEAEALRAKVDRAISHDRLLQQGRKEEATAARSGASSEDKKKALDSALGTYEKAKEFADDPTEVNHRIAAVLAEIGKITTAQQQRILQSEYDATLGEITRLQATITTGTADERDRAWQQLAAAVPKARSLSDRLRTVPRRDRDMMDGLAALLRRMIPSWAKVSQAQIDDAAANGVMVVKEIELGPGVRLKMVYISEGVFVMGSPENEAGRSRDEGPQHRVSITKGFYITMYEVTQAEWEAVMGSNPSRFKGPGLPVENVSWKDCHEFSKKLSQRTGSEFRLPTEAEWECACRAGTETPFCLGALIHTDRVNYNGNFIYGKSAKSTRGTTRTRTTRTRTTRSRGGRSRMPGAYPQNYGRRFLGPTPVYRARKGEYRQRTVDAGTMPPNAFGLYEVHGNVQEWCADWYHADYYSTSPQSDPSGPASGESRVARGGAWLSRPGACRSANRQKLKPDVRNDYTGFRVAQTLRQSAPHSPAKPQARDTRPSTPPPPRSFDPLPSGPRGARR